MAAPVVPPSGPGSRKGSLCMAPQQFGYPCTPYSGTNQWANPTGSSQAGLLGAMPPAAPPVSLQQGFHIGTNHKSSGGSSSNAGRTTQAN